MNFDRFNSELQAHISLLSHLPFFTVNVNTEEMWNVYLDSFPEGTNEIYKTCREYDCQCCKNFIRTFGNVIVIDGNGEVENIWDFTPSDSNFAIVCKAMNDYIAQKTTNGIYIATSRIVGQRQSTQLVNNLVIKWNHFNVQLPDSIILTRLDNENTVRHAYNQKYDLLNKLLELDKETINTVIELIESSQIYRGEEKIHSLKTLQECMEKYTNISEVRKNNYIWYLTSSNINLHLIYNSAMGELLKDIDAGKDIEEAITKYEKMMAPENYQRPKAVFTAHQIEMAQKAVEKLGLTESLPRRFAHEDDISVADVLWVNRHITPKIKDVFGGLKPVEKKKNSMIFSDTLNIDEFLNLLPSLTSIEIQFASKLQNKLISLIAPQNANAPSLFKWGNNFSWTYNGNITDSSRLKNKVKSEGGKVDGVLRFSISWENNPNDLDAHCKQPSGRIINFVNKHDTRSTGMLDVDIISPGYNSLAVENITWSEQRKMDNGTYRFYVHNYRNRGGKDGFNAEVEFDNQLYQFHYAPALRQSQIVDVATVKYDGESFSLHPKLAPTTLINNHTWGLNIESWCQVKIVTLSPNYWNNKAVGNKHYIFVVSGCNNPDKPSGFFNEYLRPDLQEHKKVFEGLTSFMRVEDDTEQLSGFGFSSTQHDSVMLRISGTEFKNRIIAVNF